MNLYGFAGGDPVNFSDPFGLCTPFDLALPNATTKRAMWAAETGRVTRAKDARDLFARLNADD